MRSAKLWWASMAGDGVRASVMGTVLCWLVVVDPLTCGRAIANLRPANDETGFLPTAVRGHHVKAMVGS